MGWFILIIIVVIVIAIISAQEKAKNAYQRSLNQLKRDPANSDLRQQTLALGRTYSNLMRNNKGNTIFDEVALMNDINAACAATHQMIGNHSQVASQESIEDRLTKLQNLKEKGLIDENDLARKKREIMDQI
jgi:Tfp pilus assembly protein PilE